MKPNDNMIEFEKVKKQYEKQRKIGFIAGILFLAITIFFIVVSIVCNKPTVLCGVPLQLIAGTMLLYTNRR